MKRYIFLVVLLCCPALALGAPPTSTIPITSSISTTTTAIILCFDNSDCIDDNPCTNEFCNTDNTCYFYPEYLAPCDDGLFCNGDDRCQYGDCSEHTGDPCPAGTVCNEDTDSCDASSGTSTTTTANQATTSTSIINGTTTTIGGFLSISGYITGATEEGVTVILAGTASITSITDTDGYYEFPDLAGGYYTLKPEKDGYSFEPPNHVIPNLTSVLVEMNFEATQTRCLARSIYGEGSKEAQMLRFFRDNVLSTTQAGQELIKLYYQWSPIIVRAIEADEDFKQEVKDIVDKVLEMVE